MCLSWFLQGNFLSFHGNELGLKLIYVEKTNKSCAFFHCLNLVLPVL